MKVILLSCLIPENVDMIVSENDPPKWILYRAIVLFCRFEIKNKKTIMLGIAFQVATFWIIANYSIVRL